METYISEILIVAFSSVKFMFAPALAILHYKMSYLASVFLTSLGGCLGVFFFTQLSKAIIGFVIRASRWLNIPAKSKRQKTFTRRNRLIVHIKTRYGLWGLVVLTPVFLSIPLGAFLAEHYYPKKQTLYYQFASVFGWSFTLNAIFIIF